MDYENDPTTLTFPLALFEKYGKDYKPPLYIILSNNFCIENAYLVNAGLDWISVVNEEGKFMIPSVNITMVKIEQ